MYACGQQALSMYARLEALSLHARQQPEHCSFCDCMRGVSQNTVSTVKYFASVCRPLCVLAAVLLIASCANTAMGNPCLSCSS